MYAIISEMSRNNSQMDVQVKHIAMKFVEPLRIQYDNLFHSAIILGAVIMDPRFNWQDGESVKYGTTNLNKGTIHLFKLYLKLHPMPVEPHASMSDTAALEVVDFFDRLSEDTINNVESEDMDVNSTSIFNQLLGGSSSRTQTPRTTQIVFAETVEDVFRKFSKEIHSFIWHDKIKALGKESRFNIFDFWLKNEVIRHNYPMLASISHVILSIPSSQVKVERDFSSYALVASHLRSRLSSETLNAILIMKHNIDFLDKINFSKHTPNVEE